jgi:diguanylate cyclase (GGDEF)-like protein
MGVDMLESSSGLGTDRSAASLVPRSSLAAAPNGDKAISRACIAWRLPATAEELTPGQSARNQDGWFQVMKCRLKSLALPRSIHSRLSSEIVALQRVVAEMREALRDAQQRETRARYLAFHDDLTALPNRRFFRGRLEHALAQDRDRAPRLAVIYLDLDGFKALNDAHGHDTGDQLLHLVAVRLTHALRNGDLVSRLGGDEFACLITGVSSRDRLEQIARSLFEAVSHPFTVGPLMLNVRPSIGIAVYPSDGLTADALLKAADGAMYRAKRAKLTCAFAESTPHEAVGKDLGCNDGEVGQPTAT